MAAISAVAEGLLAALASEQVRALRSARTAPWIVGHREALETCLPFPDERS